MEELNRHINDRTKLFMGISVDPEMGQRLSVSIISSLGSPVGPEVSRLPQAAPNEGISKAKSEHVIDAGRSVPDKPAEFPEPDPSCSDALLPEMDIKRFSVPEREPVQDKESAPPSPP